MKELGVPIIEDSMGGNAAGAYWFTQSVNPVDETRSTSQGFYVPSSPNMHLLIGHRVTKVIMESRRVQGVEFSAGANATRRFVNVSQEAILSAGALHTPQILQLSGIGEAAHLSNLGIETMVDLPGVGWNYHDHTLLFTGHTGKPLFLLVDLLLT
jgi:choline dehydrogenase-like flavoprotein